MPASDFRVQQFEVVVEAGDPLTLVTIPQPVDIAKTRIMLGSPGFNMVPIGYVDGVDSMESRDTHCGITIYDSNTIAVLSSSSKQWPAILSFSILEYTGPAGGANEFEVYRGSRGLSSGTQFNIKPAIPLADDECQKLTSMMTGCLETEPAGTGDRRLDLTACVVQTYVANIDNRAAHYIICRDDDGLIKTGYWEATNWTGSNWSIVRPPLNVLGAGNIDLITFTGASATNYTIDDVGDWSNTFIEAQRAATSAALGSEGICHIFPQPGTTIVQVYARTGHDTSNVGQNGAVFAAISNPEIKVMHYGQFLEALPSPTPIINLSGFDYPSRRWEWAYYDERGDVVIDGPESRVVAIFQGSKGSYEDGADVISVLHQNSNGKVVYRRGSFGGGGWNDYLQVVQFGLEAEDTAILTGSVIDKPDLSITFET